MKWCSRSTRDRQLLAATAQLRLPPAYSFGPAPGRAAQIFRTVGFFDTGRGGDPTGTGKSPPVIQTSKRNRNRFSGPKFKKRCSSLQPAYFRQICAFGQFRNLRRTTFEIAKLSTPAAGRNRQASENVSTGTDDYDYDDSYD